MPLTQISAQFTSTHSWLTLLSLQLEWALSEIRDHRGRLSNSWEDDNAPLPQPASTSALIQNQEGQEGDDPTDLSSDPEVELQILSKMEALAQRVTLCEQRLEE